MPRDYRRQYEDDSPRSPSGLSLSTGRFAGRPGGGPSRTRHNPLRDDDRLPHSSYDQTRAFDDDDDDWHESRRRSNSPRENSAKGSRSGGGRHITAPEPTGPVTLQDMLANVLSALPSSVKHAGHGQSFRRGMDWQTAALGAVIVVLLAIIAMAIAHVGPFTPNVPTLDAERHTGIQSAVAVQGNGLVMAQNAANQVALARPIEPDLAAMTQHEVTRQDLSSLSGQVAPFAFALNTADDEEQSAPVLSDESLVSLSNALAYYETNDFDVSYLIMDLGTGRGIAGNLDASIYGASTFKGPYCAYIVSDEFPTDISKARSSRITQVENAITWSDNTSYTKLRNIYGEEGMEEWLSEAGVDTALVHDTSFPTYTARQSALMWLKIYRYLTEADTTAAEWLSDTFAKTEVSFLRDGALGTTSAGHTDYVPEESDDEEGEELTEESAEVLIESGGELVETSLGAVSPIGADVVVRNKAGWINDADVKSVSDAGIVTINGRDYLMVVMTGAPDTAEGERAFSHLARTLFEIRGDLV